MFISSNIIKSSNKHTIDFSKVVFRSFLRHWHPHGDAFSELRVIIHDNARELENEM